MAPTFNACRICYQIEGKLKNYKGGEFYVKAYENLTGQQFQDLPYLSKFCPLCACTLRKVVKFQKQCHSSLHGLIDYYNAGTKISPTYLQSKSESTAYRPVVLDTWQPKDATVIDCVHSPKRQRPKPKEFFDIGIMHLSVPKDSSVESWLSRSKPQDPFADWGADGMCSGSDEEERTLQLEAPDAGILGTVTDPAVKVELGTVLVPVQIEASNVKEIEVKSEADPDNMTLQQMKLDLENTTGINIDAKNTEKGNKRKRNSKKHKRDSLSEDSLTPQAKRQKTNQDLEDNFTITTYNTVEAQTQEFLGRKDMKCYLEGRYKCELCLKSFKEEKWMDTHVKKHEPPAGPFVCGICKIRCRTAKLFRTHRDANHTTKYACKRCEYHTFSKAQALKHHGWHEGVEHSCQHCGATFRKHTTYMGHLRRAHPSSYICGVCARSFVSAYGLNLHIKAVHKDINKVQIDSVKCEECDVTFVSHKIYIRHILISDKHKERASDILGCRKCGEQFDSKEAMEKHTHYKERKLVRKPEAPERSIKCDECEEVFSHPNGVYQHYLREHPDKPYRFAVRRHYLCEQCGKTFKSPGLLRQHALVHAGLRPPPARKQQGRNPCRLCGKTYSKLSGLFRHKLTHLGVRRHKCPVCGKAFTDASNLRQHVQGVHLHVRRARAR